MNDEQFRVVCRIRRPDGKTVETVGDPISYDLAVARRDEQRALGVAAYVIRADLYGDDDD